LIKVQEQLKAHVRRLLQGNPQATDANRLFFRLRPDPGQASKKVWALSCSKTAELDHHGEFLPKIIHLRIGHVEMVRIGRLRVPLEEPPHMSLELLLPP